MKLEWGVGESGGTGNIEDAALHFAKLSVKKAKKAAL